MLKWNLRTATQSKAPQPKNRRIPTQNPASSTQHLQTTSHVPVVKIINMAAAKVFIVTGASKGIGAAVANYLLGQSHKVVLAARSGDLLESVKKSHPTQVEYIAGDMTSSDVCPSYTGFGVLT